MHIDPHHNLTGAGPVGAATAMGFGSFSWLVAQSNSIQSYASLIVAVGGLIVAISQVFLGQSRIKSEERRQAEQNKWESQTRVRLAEIAEREKRDDFEGKLRSVKAVSDHRGDMINVLEQAFEQNRNTLIFLRERNPSLDMPSIPVMPAMPPGPATSDGKMAGVVEKIRDLAASSLELPVLRLEDHEPEGKG